jgi:hypothetical protein
MEFKKARYSRFPPINSFSRNASYKAKYSQSKDEYHPNTSKNYYDSDDSPYYGTSQGRRPSTANNYELDSNTPGTKRKRLATKKAHKTHWTPEEVLSIF